VFGYTFDINGAGAVEICREKAATSLVLDGHGVPNITHKVFLSPSNPMTAEYVPTGGIWKGIQKAVEEWGLPMVLKPLKGTGGLGVTKCRTMRDVEAAVQVLHGQEYGLAISPYKRVVDEYRCICCDGQVELVYRKVRAHVVGDGSASLGTLVGRCMGGSDPKEAAALIAAAAELRPEELSRVPAKGEEVPVNWRHNLGQGAAADLNVPTGKKRELADLALRAAAAIGIRFCSVDVVGVESEGLMIMEVNSGVMMDSLMGQLGEEGISLAERMYETAVLRSLSREPALAMAARAEDADKEQTQPAKVRKTTT
jgi:glutathione synthase/RimK-type ligase-like ATP-grasp enzyme